MAFMVNCSWCLLVTSNGSMHLNHRVCTATIFTDFFHNFVNVKVHCWILKTVFDEGIPHIAPSVQRYTT